MKLKDQELWDRGVANNQDGYGSAVYRYAERWADKMEDLKDQGKLVSEIADQTSHEADTEGITGFMYGAAVNILASTWEHGEDLRIWHNLDTQIGTEGEEANKKPGVTLNPAILNIR
jgi:hypothetical protein